jgi:tRNA dimethylallyltransferase
MFAAGLLDEVRRLLDRGFSPDLPSMSAIGYRECVAVLRGEMDPDEARVSMKRSTRVFVRRQSNWFKQNDPGIRWFEAGQTPLQEIYAAIQALLNNRSFSADD